MLAKKPTSYPTHAGCKDPTAHFAVIFFTFFLFITASRVPTKRKKKPVGSKNFRQLIALNESRSLKK
jgi:hypothetical protein